MNRKSILLILLALLMCLSLVSCGDKEITKLTIDEGLAYEYDLNSTPDFSAVKATVTYNDDSTVAVTADDLTFGKIDTTTAGKKELTITYNDFTITVEVTVKGASLPSGGEGDGEGGDEDEGVTTLDVYAAELPANITLFNTNSGNNGRFTTKGDTYKVGNANPFKFTLSLLVLDENDDMVTVTQYTSASVVTLNGVACTSEYVTIDEENNTFQFTAAAVGKTFVISTRPANIPAEDVADYTKSLTVEVVAGYNVTNAKELNLMTNDEANMYEGYAPAGQEYNTEYQQDTVAKRFVDQQFGNGYYDTYGGDAMKGIVLHCDLAITKNDIPSDYILNRDSTDPAKAEGVDDATTLFNHALSDDQKSFGMYGNYFTVDTSALPMMTNDTRYVDTQVSSDSDVFGISASWKTRYKDLNQLMSFDYTQYTAVVENLALRDNDPNSNTEEDNARHMLGLNCFDVHHIDITFDNTIIEAYTISLVPSNSNMKLTVANCQLNNAWQNHIFAWTHNKLQSDADVFDLEAREKDPWETMTPIVVVIENSKLTKCGGPVIMAMTDNNDRYNATAGLNVTVDANSELWSYVTGSEAWFKAYEGMGATTYATLLKAISGAISNTAATTYGTTASMTTTREGAGDEQFMNMVFVSLSGNAKYTVNGTVMMDSTDAMVTAHKTGSFAAAPLIQSTVDPTATATWLGEEGEAMGLPQTMVCNATNPMAAIDSDFFTGDYVNFHYPIVGIAVVMGYYH